LLNAPAGALRAIARLRPTKSERSPRANRLHRRSVGVARGLGARLSLLAHVAHLAPHPTHRPLPVALRRSLVVRLASERMIPLMAALVVVGASVVSLQPAAAQPVTAAAVTGSGVRLSVGGELGAADALDRREVAGPVGDLGGAGLAALPNETYADDGTIWKPVAPDTIVQDGRGLLQTYTVRAGDTLTGIASHYGVSMMTVWWANKLTSKDDLHVGQALVIPPVNGLVVTVKDGDTLDSLAAAYKVEATQVVSVNQLEDPTLIIGQTLILPDAVGAPIPTPKPTPRPQSGGGGGGSGGSCNCSGPSTYSGGAFTWPVVGGGNYISQYYHYGHYALDIAADYGSKVRAAAGGKVTFAGWKSNGGGYQIWISNGSGIYTTYNHLSSVGVSAGTTVGEGQAIGRVGQSGRATGPHLHFEVWVGAIWNGGYRVNPLKYF
jgi:murein DD-endopeptidase MepM/ murein hydrolase activator NlpD